MRLSDFDYTLPPASIAQRPLEQRDASRMLLLSRQGHRFKDSQFQAFPDLLRGDELIVVNNVRVIPARLLGRRLGVHAVPPSAKSPIRNEFLSSEIEVLLTRQISGDEWEALVRPGRKMQMGERVEFGDGELSAEVISRGEYGERRLRLSARGDVLATISKLGHIPLPPYIDREDESADRERYQTIFADRPGAVAAPTAGLHFSPAIMERLKQRGMEVTAITLDVGLGTFQPIREDEIDGHRMHAESYEISEPTVNAIRKARKEGRPIVAIGTTVVRALEDAAIKAAACSTVAERSGEDSLLNSGAAEADIFIRPGHRFRIVDQLLTNFHLPQSTLLVLVSAFAGREFILDAYRHAVESGYRFYSYGDCMWIR
jgi:S-adenosylmethionine:tRNA ribosyltransferase-isomerase